MATKAGAGRGSKKTGDYPVWLLLGPERIKKRARVKELLVANQIEDEQDNPARCVFFASDTRPEEIMTEVSTYPFFGGKKAVIVHEAEKLPRQALLDYLSSPLETTLLILLSEKAKGKFSLPLERACEKVGRIEMFWDLFEDRLAPWAEELARQSYQLSYPAGFGDFLLDACGRNMSLIEQSIQILANRFGANPFSLEQAFEVIGGQRGANVFECVAACFSGDLRESQRQIKELLNEGEEPVFIEYLLMRQAELLWRYLALGQGTQAALGLATLAFRSLQTQARGWKLEGLAEVIILLAELDRRLKSEPRALAGLRLELALIEIVKKKTPGALDRARP